MRKTFLRGALVVALLAPNSLAASGRDLPPLVDAARRGDTSAVQALLQEKADVNAQDVYGNAALHWAVESDDIGLVDTLLRSGADADVANRYGVTPLSLAVTNGNAEMIERLVEAGADVNASLLGGETMLMTAARTGRPDAIRRLLTLGAEVNAREESYGQTALMWAAMHGNAEAIRVLAEFGADVHATSGVDDPAGATAETKNPGEKSTGYLGAPDAKDAAQFPPEVTSEWIAREFLSGRDSVLGSGNLPRPTGAFTPLLFAVRAGNTDTANALLDVGANVNDAISDGMSALTLAIFNAHWELAAMLLDRGADPNDNRVGWTALHQVAHTRTLPVGHLPHPVSTGQMSSLELAKKLLAYGADVNARQTDQIRDGHRWRFDGVGATPFFRAAKGVDFELMRLLLDNGADPHMPNVNSTTPLMAAAGVAMFNPGEDSGTTDDALEAVQLLLDAGADIHAANDNGEDAVHGAAYRGANEIIQLLVDHGAKIDRKNIRGWTPLMIADGVFYSRIYKTQEPTAAFLRHLLEERGQPTADLRTEEDRRGAKLP